MTSMQFRVLSSALAALEVWYRARSQDFITCQISIWYSPRLYRTHCLKYSHELISLAPRPLPLCCSLCVYNIAHPFFEQEKPKNWALYWNEAIELLSSQDGIYIAVLFVYVVWQGLLFGYFSCTSCLPGYCTQNMNISHFAGSTHNVVSIQVLFILP